MYMGTERVGDFEKQHNLTVGERAQLQGFGKTPVWPAQLSDSTRKDLVAQCIPPPFAAVLSRAVYDHQLKALREINMKTAVAALVDAPGEVYAEVF